MYLYVFPLACTICLLNTGNKVGKNKKKIEWGKGEIDDGARESVRLVTPN